MNNSHKDSLKEEMEILEEFNKQFTGIFYLYNKLQDRLEEKNKLISLLSRDLIDSKKEIDELHVIIEFYKEKNAGLQNYLEENKKQLDETRESLICEIKRLCEENRKYQETNCRHEQAMASAMNDNSFTGFNEKIRPIDKNGNMKR